MKKIMFILLIAILLLAITGCKEKIITVDNNQNNGRVIAYLHGIIRDANNSQALSGITVTWINKGKTCNTTTDERGYYAINNLVPGDYELTFSGRTEYAIQSRTITVPGLDEIGIDNIPTGKDFNYSMNEDISLYQANANVIGYVRARTSTSDLQPVANMKVRALITGYGFIPAYYEATTDNNGKYQFNNLPAVRENITIYAFGNVKIGDYYYSNSAGKNVTLIANQTVQADMIELEINDEEVIIVSHTAEEYTRGSTIEITFDKEINQSTFHMQILKNANANIGADNYSITWINVKKIRITFADGYSLSPNTIYRIYMEGQAKAVRASIANFDVSIDFLTKNY